jgi:hypothetical protein
MDAIAELEKATFRRCCIFTKCNAAKNLQLPQLESADPLWQSCVTRAMLVQHGEEGDNTAWFKEGLHAEAG